MQISSIPHMELLAIQVKSGQSGNMQNMNQTQEMTVPKQVVLQLLKVNKLQLSAPKRPVILCQLCSQPQTLHFNRLYPQKSQLLQRYGRLP